MRLVSIALLASCAAACQPCAEGEPSLTLGTGTEQFVTLEQANHQLELIHGPQGGYHIILAVRAKGLHPKGLVTGRMTGTIEGQPLADNSIWTELDCDRSSDSLQSLDLFLIYDAEPEQLHQQLTDIEVWVTDIEGMRVEASAQVTIHDPSLE